MKNLKRNEVIVRVDDKKFTRKKNEEIMGRRLFRNFIEKENVLETVYLTGPGAKKLIDVFGGEDAIFDVLADVEVSNFYKKRYSLDEYATLQSLLDAVPLYSAVHMDVTRVEMGCLIEYHMILIKEIEETSDLASFRVPKVSFNLKELVDPNLR